jgi:transposase
MKKRIYQARLVKSVDLEKLGHELSQQDRVVFAIDVAKQTMFAAVKVKAEDVLTTLKWTHLEETPTVVHWLASLPTRVEVALEPSGTYGDALRWQLQQAGLTVFRVSPKKVKDSREIYDGVPSTHDGKAAAIIGWLHWLGRSELWPERNDTDRALAASLQTVALYQAPYQQCQNRLEAQLARYWPELPELLELKAATLLELLMEFGSPQAVAAAPQKARALLLRVGGPNLALEKIDAVVNSPRTTLGVPMVAAEREALQALAAETRRLQKMTRSAQRRAEELGESDPMVQQLGTVVGKLTAVVLTVYGGRISGYRNAACWEKSLGLNLKIRSSGKYAGRVKITKRGPGLARKYLYLAALRWIRDDSVVRRWYEAKVRRQGGTLKTKAVVAVMRKLARALWWVGQGEPFAVHKLFDMRRLGLTP